MSNEKCAEYEWCLQASGSWQFLFALVRQPSVLKGERLEELLHDWAKIKKSSAYKKAIEQSKARTEPEAEQKAVLQNLRMQINRLCQKGEGTEDLLQELRDQEKSYERGKKRSLDATTPPRSAHNRRPRAASARRALRSRQETHDIPPRPDRNPRMSSITPTR